VHRPVWARFIRVTRRINEIGIRLALGARRGGVILLIMRETYMMVGIGIVIGLAVSLIVTRQITSTLLYGVTPNDSITMVLAIVLIAIVAGLGGYLPARRASRVDPMAALHYE
jgi:ABC-type antimicrobial peptide transport system permease subunit